MVVVWLLMAWLLLAVPFSVVIGMCISAGLARTEPLVVVRAAGEQAA